MLCPMSGSPANPPRRRSLLFAVLGLTALVGCRPSAPPDVTTASTQPAITSKGDAGIVAEAPTALPTEQALGDPAGQDPAPVPTPPTPTPAVAPPTPRPTPRPL